MKARLGAIVQARMGSTRLPGKVLMDIAGKTAIARVLERVSKIRAIGDIVVAIPDDEDNVPLADEIHNLNYTCFKGSESDVLHRYYSAANQFGFDTIVRVTGDCPMLDPDISTRVIEGFQRGRYDYYSNVHPSTYPDGLDTEVFSMTALCQAWAHGKDKEREHVTPYIWKRPYKFHMGNMMALKDSSMHRWTLDTEDDLRFIRKVYNDLGPDFRMKDVLALSYAHTLTRTIKL